MGLENLDNKYVLDLGCATGVITRNLVVLFKKKVKAVYGVDVDSSQIELARLKDSDNFIKYIKADMNDLPFDDGFFDIVYSRFAIHYSDDLKKTIKEVARVLKTGGKFSFIDAHPIPTLFRKKSANYLKKEEVFFPIYSSDLKVSHPSFTFSEYCNAIVEGGFKIIWVGEYEGEYSKSHPYRVPSEIVFLLEKIK